jgi:hypothetical protein
MGEDFAAPSRRSFDNGARDRKIGLRGLFKQRERRREARNASTDNDD